jgi:hypothetical protein
MFASLTGRPAFPSLLGCRLVIFVQLYNIPGRMPEPKIVIAGTGRAGTTLLVQVLGDLGFATGLGPGVRLEFEARAGLEGNIRLPNAPRVVKAPGLSIELDGLIAAGTVAVEHVIIPVRDLDIAAASRVRAAGYGRDPRARGGMIGRSKRAGNERAAIAEWLATLIVTVTKYDLPHTLLAFPRFAQDADYCFAKLGGLDPRNGAGPLTVDDFRRVLADRYEPDFVHEQPLGRDERLRVLLNTPVGLAKRGIAAARRVLPKPQAGRANKSAP